MFGFVLDMVQKKGEGTVVSNDIHERPNLARIINAFGKTHFGTLRPFTSVQILKDRNHSHDACAFYACQSSTHMCTMFACRHVQTCADHDAAVVTCRHV